jgi:peroxiredoxin
MEFKIQYNNESFDLCEDFIDVGYMAENVEVMDITNTKKEIQRSHEDKSMTLLISMPDLREEFLNEMIAIDTFMKDIQVPIYCYFILDKEYEEINTLKENIEKFEIVYDREEEFGNMYGTKIISGSFKDKLTKALFLISKDGAVFYLDMKDDLLETIDLQILQIELNKAYMSYTGAGCHG